MIEARHLFGVGPDRIGFLDIPAVIEQSLEQHTFEAHPSLETIFAMQEEVTEIATRIVRGMGA